MNELSGARQKLRRGEYHTDVFEQLTDMFFRAYPCEISPEVDAETREQVWRVTRINPNLPNDLSLVLGDALANLRAPLDYLAWELVKKAGHAPGRHTSFPISATLTQWKSARNGRFDPLAGMSRPAITLVESYQPCFIADAWTKVKLKALQRLTNSDKHRQVSLVVVGSIGPGFTSEGELGPVVLHSGAVELGSPVIRVGGTPVYVKPHCTFGVAIHDPGGDTHGLPAAYVLRSIHNTVDGIISHFNREFFG